VTGDHTTQNRVENMHQTGSAEQGGRFHLWSNEKESGQITEEMMEIHEVALDASFLRLIYSFFSKIGTFSWP